MTGPKKAKIAPSRWLRGLAFLFVPLALSLGWLGYRTARRPPLPPDADALITLTPTALSLGALRVAEMPPTAALIASGFPLAKPPRPGISRLAEALDAMPASAQKAGKPRPAVRILADEGLPFRALFEVLATADAARLEASLITRASDDSAQGSRLPGQVLRDRCERTDHPSPSIDVLALPEGIALRTDRGPIGPGCGPGEGLTLPVVSEQYPHAALRECLAQLLADRPEYADSQLSIAVYPAMQVREFHALLAALRGPSWALRSPAPVVLLTPQSDLLSSPEWWNLHVGCTLPRLMIELIPPSIIGWQHLPSW